MPFEPGETDDALTRLRMENDALRQQNHAQEVELSVLRRLRRDVLALVEVADSLDALAAGLRKAAEGLEL